jgi:hypothetical protein
MSYPDSPWKECPDCRYCPTIDCELCENERIVWYTMMPTEN